MTRLVGSGRRSSAVRFASASAVAFATLVTLLSACGRSPDAEASTGRVSTSERSGTLANERDTAAKDSVRGTVTEIGNAPLTSMVLTTIRGEAFALAPMDASRDALQRTVGLDIVVYGEATGERQIGAAPTPLELFRVSRFEVRAVNGVAARDGIVTRAAATDSGGAGGWVLLTHSGERLAVPKLPSALQKTPGARVFLSGALDAPPVSYGVLANR